MPYCAAFGCSNTTSGGKNRDRSIGFFSFPKSPVRRKAWIHAVRRKNFQPSKYATICSDHFLEDDFAKYPPKLREMGFKEKVNWKLKDEAVPSKVTLPSESTEKVPEDRGAFQKRRRRETILKIEKQERDMLATFDDAPPVLAENEMQDVAVPSCYIIKSKYVQTRPQLNPTNTKSTQTPISDINTILTSTPMPVKKPPAEMPENLPDSESLESESDESDTSSSSDESSDYSSDGYEPEDDDDFETEDDEYDEDDDDSSYLSSHAEPHHERKFIVYESCIRELLSKCNTCNATALVKITLKSGSMAVFSAECERNHVREWRTQPMLGKMAHGNLCMAATALFSGRSPEKLILFCKHLNLLCFSKRTFFRLQHAYLIPSITDVWKQEQQVALDSCKGRTITIGGDGRCDSPGHSAKYGSYTVLDLETNVVLDTQLIQCNETSSSNAMELEGLKRCKATLENEAIKVDALVTDRHVSVKKFMREKWQDVKHYFDVWHVAKGINKKLMKVSAKKDCKDLREWIKSVVNHMYWVASTSGDNGQEKKEKWCSIMSHVCNIHSGFDGDFQECEHDPIEDHKEWIKKGSKHYKMLSEVVLSAYLLRDVPKLSPRLQTYGLEVFHSVLLGFAPKHTHYFYKAMTARIYLAALHFNENGNRKQAVKKDGTKCWSVSYPKAKKGEKAVPSKVKVHPTYKYIERLLTEVFKRRQEFATFSEASKDAIMGYANAPPAVNATYQPYDKADLVKKRCTRFPST